MESLALILLVDFKKLAIFRRVGCKAMMLVLLALILHSSIAKFLAIGR